MTTLTAATVAALDAVLLPDIGVGEPVGLAFAAALSTNLHSYGFSLSAELLHGLAALPSREAAAVARELEEAVRTRVGADLSVAKPMYPNFPQQVMAASDAELYEFAVLHYLGDAIDVRILPRFRILRRDPLAEVGRTSQLTLATADLVLDQVERLLRSPVAWSPTQVDLMVALLVGRPGLLRSRPLPAPENRENAARWMAVDPDLTLPHLTGATDVLRVAVVLSGGDPSLAERIRFGRLSRPQRRALLGALDRAPGDLSADLARHPEWWKRFGERLHPGEYADRYPRAFDAFDAVRSGAAKTLAARVEAVLPDTRAAAALLRDRPGELVRRLDHLLRLDPAAGDDVLAVLRSARPASLQVLVQALAALSAAQDRPRCRLFIPKGAVGLAQVRTETRPGLPGDTVSAVTSALTGRALDILREASPLGRTYVDPALLEYTIPFGARSASRSLRTVGRGTRLALPSKDTLRLFVHWRDVDADSRVDVDLSALMLGENFRSVGEVAYYSLRSPYAWHSGDITSAPDGASEFLDVHIPSARAAGVRYVAMTAHVYFGPSFQDVPECFAGFMSRSEPQSGEIYEPTTVENRFDLSSDSRAATPVVFDLLDRTAIWLDLNVDVERKVQRNLAESANAVARLLEALLERPWPTLYHLLLLHAQARGTLVTSKEDADTVFSTGPESRLDVLDVAAITGEYLNPRSEQSG